MSLDEENRKLLVEMQMEASHGALQDTELLIATIENMMKEQ